MRDAIELSRHVRIGRRAPTEDDIGTLKKQGIRTVIDVRTDAEDYGAALSPAEEERELSFRGIAYEHRPMPMVGFTDATLDEIGALLRDAEKPVMIHCATGKRAGMVALAHTCIEAGIPGHEMLEMARNLDLVFGSPEAQHMFARYVDEREHRPGGRELRETAARDEAIVSPALPEGVRALGSETHSELDRKYGLDREAKLRLPPAPAEVPSPERKRRPPSQPGNVAQAAVAGGRPTAARPVRVRRYRGPATAPLGEPALAEARLLAAGPAGALAEPIPGMPAAGGWATIGSPLGLATAGAVVGTVLLILDRRLLAPLLITAGAMATWAAVLRGRTAEIPPEIVAAERAEDREVEELQARVERLAAHA